MSQQSKEWIKQRITSLKKQAGFSFNQDLFISILLCLVSGRDKHLILTAPPHRMQEVSQMAALICKSLFGFSTAGWTCQQNQNLTTFTQSLFATQDDEANNRKYGESLRPMDGLTHGHRPSRSTHTIDTRPSSHGSTRLRHMDEEYDPLSSMYNIQSSSPVSPVDFTLQMKRRDRPSPTHMDTLRKENSARKLRWPDHSGESLVSRPYTTTHSLSGIPSHGGRLANSIIIQHLEEADEVVQATLLELIVSRELKVANVRYNVPKPYFLVIAIMPQACNRRQISAQLLDRFFVSYDFDESVFQSATSGFAGNQRPPSSLRRAALMRHEEIKRLGEQAAQVHINIDITRYIRDIVVGIRTHPMVNSGLTARASQDIISVTKSLAALFQRNYLTPDLVSIAVDKVLCHRIHLLGSSSTTNSGDDNNPPGHNVADVIAEILRIVYVPA